MSFTIRVLFTGLCTYVRRSKDELTVVLVDARNPSRAQREAGMHPHTPFIAVPSDRVSLDPEFRQADRDVPALTGDTLAIFDLAREELAIPTPSPLKIEDFTPAGDVPKTGPEEKTLAWLAALERLGFGMDDLHPACFGDLDDGPIVARVKITGGNVYSRRIIRQDGGFTRFEFRVQSESQIRRQALADLVEVEMTVPSPGETGGPRITSSSQKTLMLLPREDGTPLEIMIGSLPLDPHAHPSPKEAPHFRWFYEILKSPPAISARPIPRAAALGALTSQGGLCPQMGAAIVTQ